MSSAPRTAIHHAAVEQRADGLLYPDSGPTCIPVQCTNTNSKDPNQNCYGQARYRCAHKKGKATQCEQYLCNLHALDSLDGRKDVKFCDKHHKFSDGKKEGCIIQ